jgi:hypothetical protein
MHKVLKHYSGRSTITHMDALIPLTLSKCMHGTHVVANRTALKGLGAALGYIFALYGKALRCPFERMSLVVISLYPDSDPRFRSSPAISFRAFGIMMKRE